MKNKKENIAKYDYDKIFHMYTKYRFSTYSNIMTYDNQIFKFKENVHSYNKTLKGMESSLLPKKFGEESVQIFVKEDKKIKKYEEQSKSDEDTPQNNSSNSDESSKEQKEESDHKKTKSEPKIEIEENNDKNKNNITKKEEKKFCIVGNFPDFLEALTKRNWKQTKEPEKLSYDFLFTLKITDVPFEALDENVIINHLRKIGEETKKTGLLKNLRNLYYLNLSPDDFYPRAYDISERQDIEDFIEDFKVS